MFLTEKQIIDYQNNGVIIIKDIFKDWIEPLKKRFQKALNNPSKHVRENIDDNNGRFFEDYCNWENIKEFQKNILIPELNLGDSVLFNFKTVHGSLETTHQDLEEHFQ